MTNPRRFFETMAKPAYEAWLADPLAEWKAKAAVAYADDLAERLVVYWTARKNLTPIAGRATAYTYRTYLRSICPDFGLVWDVHDGTKHVKLDRGNREITTAGQAGVGRIPYGEGRYGEGAFGGSEQIVIELDNGEKRALAGVMETVMSMWKKKLYEMEFD